MQTNADYSFVLEWVCCVNQLDQLDSMILLKHSWIGETSSEIYSLLILNFVSHSKQIMQILAVLHERELDYYANATSLDLYGNLIMSGRMRFFLRFYCHAPQPRLDCWGDLCSLRQMWTSSISSLFSRALPANHFFILDCFLNSFILVLSLFCVSVSYIENEFWYN